jgi:hypothetical protein
MLINWQSVTWAPDKTNKAIKRRTSQVGIMRYLPGFPLRLAFLRMAKFRLSGR